MPRPCQTHQRIVNHRFNVGKGDEGRLPPVFGYKDCGGYSAANLPWPNTRLRAYLRIRGISEDGIPTMCPDPPGDTDPLRPDNELRADLPEQDQRLDIFRGRVD